MRIAFDVMGTLIQSNKAVTVRRLLYLAAQRGHNITVWSNSFTYAQDFIEDYPSHGELVHQTMTKRSKSDLEERGSPLFDIAFEDDTNQTYLGANKFVFVQDIPEENLEDFLDSLGIVDISKNIEEGTYVDHSAHIGIEMWKREGGKWYHLSSYSDNTVKWTLYPAGPDTTKIMKLQDVTND